MLQTRRRTRKGNEEEERDRDARTERTSGTERALFTQKDTILIEFAGVLLNGGAALPPRRVRT
jgi:hypothetical protein